jgi:drug/metabolite transporter (DMT)-like permease
MQYSRKGYWTLRGVWAAIVIGFCAYVWVLRPSPDALRVVPYVVGAVIIAGFALGIRAYLYLDEIQRARRMHAFFYGAMLGAGCVGIILLSFIPQPSRLEALADILSHHQPHAPIEYFAIGIMATILAQIIGTQLMYLAMRLKSSA